MQKKLKESLLLNWFNLKAFTNFGKYLFVIGCITFILGVIMFLNSDLPSAALKTIGGIIIILSSFFRKKRQS